MPEYDEQYAETACDIDPVDPRGGGAAMTGCVGAPVAAVSLIFPLCCTIS